MYTEQDIADMIMEKCQPGYSLLFDEETGNWYFRSGEWSTKPLTAEQKAARLKSLQNRLALSKKQIEAEAAKLPGLERTVEIAVQEVQKIVERKKTVPYRSETWTFLERITSGGRNLVATAENNLETQRSMVQKLQNEVKELERQCSQLQ